MVNRSLLAVLFVVMSLILTLPCVAHQSSAEREILELEEKMNAAPRELLQACTTLVRFARNSSSDLLSDSLLHLWGVSSSSGRQFFKPSCTGDCP